MFLYRSNGVHDQAFRPVTSAELARYISFHESVISAACELQLVNTNEIHDHENILTLLWVWKTRTEDIKHILYSIYPRGNK